MKGHTVTYPKGYFEDIRGHKKQRIYDCVAFFNELDLLELRLKELYNDVDYFVVAEGTRTFSGEKKKLYYKDNKKLFRKWEDKIIHVVVDMPKLTKFDKFLTYLEQKLPRKIQLPLRKVLYNLVGGISTYKLAEIGKRGVKAGVIHAKDDDIILGIDLDEIPKGSKMKEVRKKLKTHLFVDIEQRNYRYFLNGEVDPVRDLPATRACYYKTFKKAFKSRIDYLRTSPYLWRKFFPGTYGRQNYALVKNAGWHFSFLGGAEKVIQKFFSLEHPEWYMGDLKSTKKVEEMIDKGEFPLVNYKVRYVKIDSTFPEDVQKNKKRWNKFIKN